MKSAAAALQILIDVLKEQTKRMEELEKTPREVKLPANVQPQAAAAEGLSDK